MKAAARAIAKAAQLVYTIPPDTTEVPVTGWQQLEKQLLDVQRALQRGAATRCNAAPDYSSYEKLW